MKAEVLVGPERRRRWSAEAKARIVAASMVPGAKVAEIARRHEVSRGLIYTWRREARQGLLVGGAEQPGFVPVVVSAGGETGVLGRERCRARDAVRREGIIEVALPGDMRLTVRGCIEERTLRLVLRALRSA
jgi:transposase-like protein